MTNQEKIEALTKALQLIESVMDEIEDSEENEELMMVLCNAHGDITDSQNMLE
jgi:hypothetical protein